MSATPIATTYFGGRLQRFAETPGFTLSEVEYGDTRACPQHSHRRAFFALLLRGGYEERFRTYGMAYRPFQVGWHPAGVEHRDCVSSPGTSVFIVELERSWLEECEEDATKTLPSPHHGDPLTVQRTLRLWKALGRGEAAEPMELESCALELADGITCAGRIERRRPRWLDRAIELLRTEYTSTLTVATVARAVSRHPVYVARTFRQFCGMSLGEYVGAVRLRAALDELGNAELPLAQVALAAGFCDQSRLTKVVKRATGMTPGGMRRFLTRDDGGGRRLSVKS